MYKLIEYSDDLDLEYFYSEAKRRGFENNSSKQVMIDCFKREREFKAWILYQDDLPIGSVGCHTLDILGPNSYRICARTCTFAEARPGDGLITINKLIVEHQNLTAQFFIPACIEFAGRDKDLYISSHPSLVGTQRMVHSVYCPTLVKAGTLEKTCEMEYRGYMQTFWKLNVDTFYKQLNSNPRWV